LRQRLERGVDELVCDPGEGVGYPFGLEVAVVAGVRFKSHKEKEIP
jgi:hypothetical protein